jgi:HKD family nuclease
MKLFLHSPLLKSNLSETYASAFSNAKELYVVSAYLTEWNSSLVLNKHCENFRLIVGKDFGITRKDACIKAMKWLPAERKSQFLIADNILGFHPKAVFWKDNKDNFYTLIGSSNLTKAAFETNYEANILSQISEHDFDIAKNWINEIAEKSVVISEDWLEGYVEGKQPHQPINRKTSGGVIKSLTLPHPIGALEHVKNRRKQLKKHKQYKEELHKLFASCAEGKITSTEFYSKLPKLWSWENGNRLQGMGWERQGKASDFNELSKSFIKILRAKDFERDDVTVREIDRLKNLKVSTRKALFSEMLCLTFPERYPVLNKPVQKYLNAIRFRAPKGASEGARYLDLARKLRSSLAQNPNHPAKSLAELDTVIWLEYGE